MATVPLPQPSRPDEREPPTPQDAGLPPETGSKALG